MTVICPPVTADTNRVSLYVAHEADNCWGADPGTGNLAAKAYQLRMTGETLIHDKKTVVSNTIRNDRMRDTISQVSQEVGGDVKFELSYRDWELMLSKVMNNDFVYLLERTFTAGTLNAVSATNRFVVTSGSIDFTHYVVGADVHVANFSNFARNSGRFIITANATSSITVNTETTGVSLGDETPTSGTALTAKSPVGSFTDLSITGGNTLASSATSFLTDVNLAVGQWIRMAGWVNAANNGVFQIATLALHAITFVGNPTLVNEVKNPVQLSAQRLKNGALKKSVLLEKFFSDVNEFVHFTGCRVASMALAVAAQAIVTGTFTVMGKQGVGTASSVLGQLVPAGTKDALNATTNVGNITENNVPLATAVKTINLTVNNNLRTKPQVGSPAPVDIGYGFVDVTGTLEAYFEDLGMFTEYFNHSQSQLAFRFTDSGGNVMIFTLPRLYFTSGTPTAPQGNADVMQSMNFTAVRDTTSNSVIMTDCLPAALL